MLEQALLSYLEDNTGMRNWVIAGGYVRDKILQRKAKDIDVFHLTPNDKTHWSLDTMNIASALRSSHVPYVVEPKKYIKSPGIQVNQYFGPPIRLRFMDYDVQLMTTPCPSAEEVISTFDYNICQFYLNEDLEVRTSHPHRLDELHSRVMFLNHTRTPLSSLRRGFLFEYRLGMKFQPQDIRSCVEALNVSQAYVI